MPVLLALLILALSLVLVKGADSVIVAIRRISQTSGVAAFTIASLVLALATSLPELFVGIVAALSGTSVLSLGNVVGANIANLAIVVGLTGLLGGGIGLKNGEFINRDLPLALLAGLAPLVLLWNRELSRVDGLLLLLIYGAYASGFFHRRFVEIGRVHQEEAFWHKLIRTIETGRGHMRRELVRFFVGAAIMLIAANFIVRFSTNLASLLGIPIFIIGLFLVSIGTTLPELTFSFRSIRHRSAMLLVGNAVGSIIANSTLILGIVVLIHPIEIAVRREYLLAAITFFVLTLVFWVFARTKNYLARWEAGTLFLIYLLFVILEISGFKII